jgi:protein-disulfide isomerase
MKVEPARAVKARAQERRAREQRQRWLTIGGLLVLAAVVVGVFFTTRPSATPLPPDRAMRYPALGPETAPVTVVEFGDFQCTTCRRWYEAGVAEQIVQTYGDKVRFVFRPVNVINPPMSGIAAEAAHCAFDQGKFWEYHDLLYDRQPAASNSDLKAYAAQLGLDTAQFNACLDSRQYESLVAADTQDALRQGLRGTPFFTINGQPLYAFTFQDFQQRIDPLIRGN